MKKSPKKAVRFRAERFCRTTLAGVVSCGKLADLLRRAGQEEWTSRVRLCGLLFWLISSGGSRRHKGCRFPPISLMISFRRSSVRKNGARYVSHWLFFAGSASCAVCKLP